VISPPDTADGARRSTTLGRIEAKPSPRISFLVRPPQHRARPSEGGMGSVICVCVWAANLRVLCVFRPVFFYICTPGGKILDSRRQRSQRRWITARSRAFSRGSSTWRGRPAWHQRSWRRGIEKQRAAFSAVLSGHDPNWHGTMLWDISSAPAGSSSASLISF
jgi:hypothetical protein